MVIYLKAIPMTLSVELKERTTNILTKPLFTSIIILVMLSA